MPSKSFYIATIKDFQLPFQALDKNGNVIRPYQKAFFDTITNFINDRYEEKNIISFGKNVLFSRISRIDYTKPTNFKVLYMMPYDIKTTKNEHQTTFFSKEIIDEIKHGFKEDANIKNPNLKAMSNGFNVTFTDNTYHNFATNIYNHTQRRYYDENPGYPSYSFVIPDDYDNFEKEIKNDLMVNKQDYEKYSDFKTKEELTDQAKTKIHEMISDIKEFIETIENSNHKVIQGQTIVHEKFEKHLGEHPSHTENVKTLPIIVTWDEDQLPLLIDHKLLIDDNDIAGQNSDIERENDNRFGNDKQPLLKNETTEFYMSIYKDIDDYLTIFNSKTFKTNDIMTTINNKIYMTNVIDNI